MLCSFVLGACGAPPPSQTFDDAGPARADAGPLAPLLPDAGLTQQALDAGAPPRTVFGHLTANGATFELTSGYGNSLGKTHHVQLDSASRNPLVQVVVVTPSDAGAGWEGSCESTPGVLVSAHWVENEQVAYFTEHQRCRVRFDHVASEVNDEYRGSFEATLDRHPLSQLDAGFETLVITKGEFRVVRTN